METAGVMRKQTGVGQGGPGAQSDFRNWTGARSAKEKIVWSAERYFFQILPMFFLFHKVFTVDF